MKLTNQATIQEPTRHNTVSDKNHPDEFPSIVDSPREMTDFGGNGQGAAVAECELNLPHSNKVTLTSSDLNELGCTTSTSAKSTVSSSGVSSGASSSKSAGDAKQRRNSDKSAAGVLSIFRKSRSVSHHEHARRVLQENRSRSRKGSNEKNPAKTRRARSSSRIFIEILRTLSKGFSSCRSDREVHSLQKGEQSESRGRRGSRFANNHIDTKGRRKSHDASHDGTNGSDSTSTGYVSDSSNEKHDHDQSKLQNQKTLSAMSEVVPNNQSGTAVCPSKIHAWAEKVVNQLDSKSPVIETAELEVVQNRVYVASSCSDEDFTEASDESFYTSQSDSVSSDYESTSTYDEDTDEKDVKHELKQLNIDDRNKKELGIIKEEDEKEINEDHASKKVKRRKSTLKRKKTMRGEEDLNKPTRKKAALKVEELDNISRSGSLKDMILQFETTMAELNIHADHAKNSQEQVEVKDSPLLGVKAIARRIQEQTEFDSMEVECMPPSQILKLKQALDLEPKEDLSQPVPLSRRSESKVAQIAKQIADAERERQKLEKAMARSGKSPKASKRQQSTSFINELLEMARAENSAKTSAENVSPGSAPDFKQSLLAARKKITQRDENLSPGSAAAIKEQKAEPAPLAASSSTEGTLGGPNEAVDPFVKEVLTSKNVPEPVKQKIRIECWSLFNDPRTPKGVKQCILATMLSKVQNE